MGNRLNKPGSITFKTIGALFGIIAVVNYVDIGLQLGIAGIVGKFLDSYRRLVDFSLGWAEPYLTPFLTLVSRFLKLDLHLYPHWKHIFVPAWLYFSNNARTNWFLGRTSYAIANALWGTLVALVLAVASGVVPATSYLALVFPVAGFIAFDLGSALLGATLIGFSDQNWTKAFAYYLKTRVLPATILGLTVISLGIVAEDKGIPGANVVMVIIYVAAIAFRDIGVSLWVTFTHDRPIDTTIMGRLIGQGSWMLGSTILAILFCATLAIIISG
jgi:hypothetical protein